MLNERYRGQRSSVRDKNSHHLLGHTAFTLDFERSEEQIQQLGHPSYSPGLAPCDSFVFPNVKRMMRDIHYNSLEAAVTAFSDLVEGLPALAWSICFQKWFQRIQLCIDAGGEYFEKM